MIIELDDDWRVNTDPHNFILEHRTVITKGDNAGQHKWTSAGFYSGMGSLLKALPDALALSPSIVTYEEYLARWEELRRSVKAALPR